MLISTHTPHTRCDSATLPFGYNKEISTHTPHTRCDVSALAVINVPSYFYSHTSYEVRRMGGRNQDMGYIFLLTHLIRGATVYVGYIINKLIISTHTPHTRCDPPIYLFTYEPINFYSHTSYEVRLLITLFHVISIRFLLTHLIRGATAKKHYRLAVFPFPYEMDNIFYHNYNHNYAIFSSEPRYIFPIISASPK